MQELLTFIVSAIVHHSEAVKVTQVESEDGQHVTLRLSVHPDDMGIIIGKGGNIARALRNIVKARAVKNNQKVYIDILESGQEAEVEVTGEAGEE
jgi:uncharacterized protein